MEVDHGRDFCYIRFFLATHETHQNFTLQTKTHWAFFIPQTLQLTEHENVHFKIQGHGGVGAEAYKTEVM